ncbi:MAG TPA: hypothetical protein VGN32_01785 [Ktedonobacterales bacterium]|nr:hypothetical protein [Ktedonobacterales bacterium]
MASKERQAGGRRGQRSRGDAAMPAVAPIVERLGPPISSVGWSPDLVAQTLEILAVELRAGELRWFKPVHADSLRVGLPRGTQPGDCVLDVLGWYPMRPRVVHSTSWRYEAGGVILTYITVVEVHAPMPPDSLVTLPIARAELVRGGAMAPPPAIGVEAVLEHALRHLSWLVRDDQAIATALHGWSGTLREYQPEPFRELG